MKVNQIAEIVNSVNQQQLGETEIISEDLSNVVSLASSISDLGTASLDNYTHDLIDRIGKVHFRDRKYNGSAPSVYMDGWEFGSILQKIEADRPTTSENMSWKLQKGQVYEQDLYTPPTTVTRFFNDQTTWDIPMSFAERQVKSAFTSGEQLNAFFSMIENRIHDTITLNNDGLIEMTINNMIGETILAEGGFTALKSNSGVRAINLLKLYNVYYTKTLTAEQARLDPDFIKFACYTMSLYEKRLAKMSRLFNIGGRERFTTSDKLHIIMLDEFKKAADVYLQSAVYHNEYTKLPNAETVAYWQGSGTGYDFSSTSAVKVKVKDLSTENRPLTEVDATGVLAIMFDRESLGINNYNYRVRSHINDRAEFTNHWYKVDARYFNDENENFIVFFIA